MKGYAQLIVHQQTQRTTRRNSNKLQFTGPSSSCSFKVKDTNLRSLKDFPDDLENSFHHGHLQLIAQKPNWHWSKQRKTTPTKHKPARTQELLKLSHRARFQPCTLSTKFSLKTKSDSVMKSTKEADVLFGNDNFFPSQELDGCPETSTREFRTADSDQQKAENITARNAVMSCTSSSNHKADSGPEEVRTNRFKDSLSFHSTPIQKQSKVSTAGQKPNAGELIMLADTVSDATASTVIRKQKRYSALAQRPGADQEKKQKKVSFCTDIEQILSSQQSSSESKAAENSTTEVCVQISTTTGTTTVDLNQPTSFDCTESQAQQSNVAVQCLEEPSLTVDLEYEEEFSDPPFPLSQKYCTAAEKAEASEETDDCYKEFLEPSQDDSQWTPLNSANLEVLELYEIAAGSPEHSNRSSFFDPSSDVPSCHSSHDSNKTRKDKALQI